MLILDNSEGLTFIATCFMLSTNSVLTMKTKILEKGEYLDSPSEKIIEPLSYHKIYKRHKDRL